MTESGDSMIDYEAAKQKRRETYLKKYGGEEGYRAEMRRRQELSMLNPNRQKGKHKGGFSDKELAKKAGRIGLEKRYGKVADVDGIL